jgi:hypothetical protein
LILNIKTPRLDYYQVNEKGLISKDGNPSGGWKFLGISHVKRNQFIPFRDLFDFLDSKPDILYKNGNPQWTVRDWDHGTTREWGNTRYHGISAIWFEGKEKFFDY